MRTLISHRTVEGHSIVCSRIHKLPHVYATASESRLQARDRVSHEPALPLGVEDPSAPVAVSQSWFLKKPISTGDLERERHWGEEGGSNLTSDIWVCGCGRGSAGNMLAWQA